MNVCNRIWVTLELGNRYEMREKERANHSQTIRNLKINLTGMKVSLFNLFVTLRHFFFFDLPTSKESSCIAYFISSFQNVDR